MNWFTLSLLTALLIAFGQVFIKKGLSNISSLWNVVFDAFFTVAIITTFTLTRPINFYISPYLFLVFLLIASLYTLFYYAIEREQISLSGTIFASYPVVTIILAQLFLKERISGLQLVMIISILLGIFLLSYVPGGISEFKKVKSKVWLFWALLGALTTGIGDFLAKATLSSVDINSYLFFFSLSFALSTLGFWALDKKGRKLPQKIAQHELKFTLLGTLMLCLTAMSLPYALSLGKASLVAATTSSYVPLTAVLAFYMLREKLSKQQIIGLVFVSLGVTFIGI